MKGKTSGQKMLLTAGFMAMATLLSKVLGLVRDSLLTAYFGSGLESDAFLTASTIPTTLFDVIIGGLALMGIRDDPLSIFVRTWWQWRKNRKILEYRGEVT